MDKVQKLRNVQRIRKLTNILDSAIGIPGTKFRIGLDPILGLIPGGGDLIGAILSGYMIYLATSLGLEKGDIVRMVRNVAIETILGTVPLVGDIFDAYFKANLRNLEILEKHLENSEREDRDLTTEAQLVSN